MNVQLLSFNEFKNLTKETQVVEQAKTLTQYLKTKYVINNEKLYTLTEQHIYEVSYKKLENAVASIIMYYINDFINNIRCEIDEELWDEMYAKKARKLTTQNYVNQSIKPLIYELTNDKIKMDKYSTDEIHFLNGYMDMRDLVFKQRVINTHYVTAVIPRDYCASTEEERKRVYNIIKKILPNKDDMNVTLMIMARSFAGLSYRYQKNTFLTGSGASGKSTIMLWNKIAFKIYFKEFKESVFNANCKSSDKSLNTLYFQPWIRMVYGNEQDGYIKESLFKLWFDALEAEQLYKDNSHTIEHYAGLFFCMNALPMFKVLNDGIIRRIEILQFLSKFIDETTKLKENPDLQIYKKDRELESQIVELANAYCDIIFEKANFLINNPKYSFEDSYTPNFTKTLKMVTTLENKIGDFIEEQLIVDSTKELGWKIYKEDMMEEYQRFAGQYNNNKITLHKLSSVLSDYKIYYNFNLRAKGGRGCYENVKFRQLTDVPLSEDEEDEDSVIIETLEALAKTTIEIDESPVTTASATPEIEDDAVSCITECTSCGTVESSIIVEEEPEDPLDNFLQSFIKTGKAPEENETNSVKKRSIKIKIKKST